MTREAMPLDQQWVPSACTLPTAEQPLRGAEFDALFAGAVQAVHRPGRTRLRLDLLFAPDNAARAAQLAARESGCCSFFTFTLTIADGTLGLEVQVPEQHVKVLDALQARAEAGRVGLGRQP
ncbi:hypothetical protein [Nonomuraea jabiensis]|uniref:Arsenate reductase n=1 Tax=Nonomuraea jabiensis TaxID=882448 RepID=A0A7W9GIL0_9ACTN|nr:hypothetical protein [Nonomuraea jabiensis]MBB5784504.1 hypothetical protein [Nonomuraea jabiensis]